MGNELLTGFLAGQGENNKSGGFFGTFYPRKVSAFLFFEKMDSPMPAILPAFKGWERANSR